MNKHLFLLAVLAVVFFKASGQGEIPVDMYTGAPVIQIPIWTVSDHDLSESVGLSYSARGLKLIEQKGIVGVGWNLLAGKSIMREVRGLPDDFAGTGGDTRRGWLYGTLAADAGNFSTSADLSSATCTDENAINTVFNSNNYLNDTEPDIFYYSVAGASGSFVFDNALNIRLVPYQDVKIEYTTVSPTDKKITSFTITTNNGTVHKFDLPVSVTKSTHKMSGVTEVEFLRRDFKLYDYTINNLGVQYNSEWKISKMESPSGASISYSYTSQSYVSEDTIKVGIRKLNSSALFSKAIYKIKLEGSVSNISQITSSTLESISFAITGGTLSKVTVSDARRLNSYIKEFNFTYKVTGLTVGNSPRTFLKSMQESSGCDALPPYAFSYIGVDLNAGKCNLPSIYSMSKDFWGFYNGKPNSTSYPKIYVYPGNALSERFRLTPIPGYAGTQYILDGADRTPDGSSMETGSLQTIIYPWGGSTTLNYEPHQYFDATANQSLLGGGLRIKSVIYFDGVNAQSKIIKNYEYLETSGVSSGQLIDRPIFVVPTREYRDPESTTIKSYDMLVAGSAQTMWESLLVRTDRDISPSVESDIIGYKRVKVLRPGAGSAEFEFAMPAIYGDLASGDWIATQNKFVRPNSCPSMELVAGGGEWAFAFSPNPNFGYDRGFMLKKIERNGSGNKVREITYTPQYVYKIGSVPAKVWGVAYEQYPNSTTNIYFYGKYFLLTDVAKVLSKETIITYDANDQAKSVSESGDYYYESTSHRLLTRKKSTTVDGTVYTTRFKYPLDYGTIPANADVQLKSIGILQTSFRNGSPIETVASYQRAGDVEKVSGASLIKFSDFGISGKVLPFQQLSLTVSDGITNFVNSDKSLQASTYVLTNDSRYSVENTFLAFDQYQVPLSSIGKDRITRTTHWGYKKSLPVVQAANANYNEFVFSNFETDNLSFVTGNEFQQSDFIYGSGRTGERSVHPKVKLTKTLQKASVSTYILSLWLKKQAGPVDFQLVLKNASTLAVVSTTNFTVSPVGTDFEYFEKSISVAGAPASFIVELQGLNFTGTYASSKTLLPVVDDVAFYPQGADLISYTYTIPFGHTSITDASATTLFVAYDQLGREKYVWDKNKDMIKKNTYKFASDPVITLTACITKDGSGCIGSTGIGVVDQVSNTFTANTECIDDVKFEWDFGEGAGFENLGSVASHVFTTLGTVSVTLRKSHPAYGTVTTTIPVTVTPKSFDVTICAKGTKEYSITTGVISTYTCSNITGTPIDAEHPLFKVTGVTTADPILSYEWYVYDDYNQNWALKATGSDSFTLGIVNSAVVHGDLKQYIVRCDITTTTGRKGTSPLTINVKMYP